MHEGISIWHVPKKIQNADSLKRVARKKMKVEKGSKKKNIV